ncbi:unnamed protein product, partial [Rotaria sp. Silwood1]
TLRHPRRWQQNSITVAGGNRQGNEINQLSNPLGLYVDDDQTIYVADRTNHCIVEWKRGATSGQVVAGGNGQGSGDHQLNYPQDVIIDKERDNLIICDYSNERGVRWPRRNGTSGETIISNIYCWGLTMDENGSLYVTDFGKHEVRRYRRGESQGTVVAGGNGYGNQTLCHPRRWQQNGITVAGGNQQGNGINQLSDPLGLYVDDDQTIYVADRTNHRIVEWKRGATSGQVVAGGNEQGSGDHQLNNPQDVIIDKERDSLIICDYSNRRVVRWPRRNGTSGETIISNIDCVGLTMDENGSLYVTDFGKHEVRRYRRGESQGTVVAGGNGNGNRLDQLSSPTYVFVDRDHSVYVSDWNNHRVMKWMEGAKQGMVVAGGWWSRRRK